MTSSPTLISPIGFAVPSAISTGFHAPWRRSVSSPEDRILSSRSASNPARLIRRNGSSGERRGFAYGHRSASRHLADDAESGPIGIQPIWLRAEVVRPHLGVIDPP